MALLELGHANPTLKMPFFESLDLRVEIDLYHNFNDLSRDPTMIITNDNFACDECMPHSGGAIL
jgi:hypothetical protein